MKQRYFKVNNKFYDGIIEGVYPLYEERNGGYAIKVSYPHSEKTSELFFKHHMVEEVFDNPTIYQVTSVSNPDINIKVGDRFIKKEEEVIDQVFSSKTYLDNYDAMINDDDEALKYMAIQEDKVYKSDKRVFESGASRNQDKDKLDFEGFLSPLALKRYAEYMHKNRKLEDGSLRDSDNWQKGIPKDQYIKSLWRHFFDTWSNHRGLETKEDQQENLCGVIFNSLGMLHELLKEEE